MKHYLLLLIVGLLVPYAHGAISDKRLCADVECQVPISEGITAIRYSSIEPNVLSFALGDQVTIYSKDAGSNRELWGAEIRGKRGYVPKRLVKEMRVLVRSPTFTVDTELEKPVPEPKAAETQVPDEIKVAKLDELPSDKVEPTLVDSSQTEPPTQQNQNIEEVFDDGEDEGLEENDENDDSNDPNEPDDEEDEDSNQETPSIDSKTVPIEAVVDELPGPLKRDVPFINEETPPVDAAANSSNQASELPVVSGFSVDDIESSLNETTSESTIDSNVAPEILQVPDIPEVSIVEEVKVDTVEPSVASVDVPAVESSQIEEVVKQSADPVEEVKQSADPVEEVKQEREEELKGESKQDEPQKEEEGLLNTALNWLGLSDSEEPLIEDKRDDSQLETIDASNLMLEIASLDPSKEKSSDETAQTEVTDETAKIVEENEEKLKTEKVIVEEQLVDEVPVDGACSKESCDKVVVPDDGFCTKESCDVVPVPVTEGTPTQEIQEESQVTETPKEDDHHHHHYPGDGHDHHHHEDHSGHGHSHGHGHAHTHLPGYIPGFGRHYKPPEQIRQEIEAKQLNHDAHVPDTLANVQQSSGPPYPPAIVEQPVIAYEDLHIVPAAESVPEHDKEVNAEVVAQTVPEVLQEVVPEPVPEVAPVVVVPEPILEVASVVPEPNPEVAPVVPESILEVAPVVPESILEVAPVVPEPNPEVAPVVPEPNPEVAPVVPEPNPEVAPVVVPEHVIPELETVPVAVLEPVQESVPPTGTPQHYFEAPLQQASNDVPEYIPVDQIFAQMEKQREKEQLINESSSLFDSLFEGFEGSYSLHVTSIAAVSVVLFLTLYYAIDNGKYEKLLRAKIAQLDAQLHEMQAIREDSGASEELEAKFEVDKADLQAQIDSLTLERATVEKRLLEVEKERENLKEEVDALTETAAEATRLFEESMTNQSKYDEWFREMQLQCDQQKLTIETLDANLNVKTAENETLVQQLEEMQSETEKFKVKIKSLQSDMETLKTANKNYQQKSSADGAEVLKLKQDKESLLGEKRTLSNQINRQSSELNEWREKVDHLKKALKSKEEDLVKTIELMKSSGGDGQAVLQLSSLVKVESELEEANLTIDKLNEEVKNLKQLTNKMETEKEELNVKLIELKSTTDESVKQKKEAETRLEVLSNYFKEKENQWQKELGSLEAKGALNEENVTDSFKRIIETEQNLALYKSQVDTLKKEIEEQERSFKLRLAAEEKRAHENWVQSRQLERRLEESKQEASQLRQRLTQVEKEKEAILTAKENGTTNGDVDVVKAKRLANGDDLPLLEPVLTSSMPPPPPVLDPDFEPLYPPPPPPAYLPPVPFEMLPIPPPPLGDHHHHHRPPPLGMMAGGSFDVDYRREMEREPPRRFGSPPRRYPSPPRSERSVRSDRSDRMDRYDDPFRPISPYGRGRPRSVGRSRDPSPDRPGSFSPLPSPLYPSTINSPNEDWDDLGRSYRPPMMRTSSLRAPPNGPKTSSPLVEIENHVRHRPI